MSKGIKNKTELLLVLLYAGETPSKLGKQKSTKVNGITRLEKLLFILKEDEDFLIDSEEESFNFIPFKMGPWTAEVYDEVDFLDSLDLIEKAGQEKQSPADAAHNDELFNDLVLDKYQNESVQSADEMEVFKLSKDGKEKGQEIWARLTDNMKIRLLEIKRRFNKMPLADFLRFIYREHPEFTTESLIKKELFNTSK